MIRINLLQEKKARRVDYGQRTFALMGVGWAAAVAAGYFLLHAPLADEVAELTAKNAKVKKEIKQLEEETKEFDTVQKQLQAAKDQEAAIARLNDARATPAWMLRELGIILTRERKPTMTPEMAERVRQDPNRQFQTNWDPKRVWLTNIVDKGGIIVIEGGAQAPTDVTQFTLRLQASAYFSGITSTKEGEVNADKGSTASKYVKFTVTGRAAF